MLLQADGASRRAFGKRGEDVVAAVEELARFPDVRDARAVIERMIRIADTFAEATTYDREDIAALSLEERISGVERLRRI